MEDGYAVVSIGGAHDEGSIGDILEQFAKSSAWQAGMPVLWDISKLDVSELHYQNLEHVARVSGESPSYRTSVRVAVFAPSDSQFGLARMYTMVAEGPAPRVRRVFRDRDLAIKWLKLEE